MTKTVIFGSSGFIGEYVVRELGDENSVGLDSSNALEEHEAYIRDATHIVWLVPPHAEILSSLIPHISNAPYLKRFVFVSSALVYLDSTAPQDETTVIEPLTNYEIAKTTEEELLRSAFVHSPQVLTIARLANVYGSIKSAGVITRIFSALKNDVPFTVHGDGSQRRDYIHVEDVAVSLLGLMNHHESTGIYNVSTGLSYTLSEVIEKIERISGEKLHVEHAEFPAPEKHSVVADNTKIQKLLDVRPRSLDKGLRQMYNHYK